MTPEVQKTLTVAVAARELHVDAATVRRWAKKGTIAVVRHPSGRMFVPESEVTRILTPSIPASTERAASAA